MSERIIKKYENRRLYDTEESRYINLETVQELVLQGHEVKVVDAKSGEDLTRHVLTQIIVEGSKDPDSGPPIEFLRDLIRSTDRANKDFLHWYLGTAQGVYSKIQDSLRSRKQEKKGDKWQREAWARVFDPLGAVRTFLTPENDRDDDGEGVDESVVEKASDSAEELLELRKRLEELEERLG